MTGRGRGVAIGSLFFLTGFSALVYEVYWTRHLTLVFGNTVTAVSTVLAAYMAGLAAGAFLFGRIADRSPDPLALYARLELMVAAGALLFLGSAPASEPLLRWLYRADRALLLGGVRFVLAFAFLMVPTMAMGGTLPALGRLLARVETAGRTLGVLYGVNTLGATLGTVATGFWLIPRLGMTRTLLVALGINTAVALAAAAMARSGLGRDAAAPSAGAAVATSRRLAVRELGLVPWAFLASGALALCLEVLWTRSLLLVFGSTVYSFSSMLALFLLGLALGSAAAAPLVRHAGKPLLVFGLLQVAAGYVTALSVTRVPTFPARFLEGLIGTAFTWGDYMRAKVEIAALVLLPLALLSGAVFPVAVRAVVSSGEAMGQRVGTLYAFNTAGAILGSLGAGFVLLPLLGLQGSLEAAAAGSVGLGTLLILGCRDLSRASRLGIALPLAGTAAALLATTPPWDRNVMSAGVFFAPHGYLSADMKTSIIDEALGARKVRHYAEGRTTTIAVVDSPLTRSLMVDGKVEASTLFDDMRLQRLQAHLPMLFAPRLERAANIGIGCGITLGSLSVYPLEEIVSIEIERNAPAAARWFAEQNHHVLDDPRLRIVFNDGRNHFKLTDERYDVVTSDPFEPLVGGAASLYTMEHFQAAAAHLSQGGVFAQYLPMYQMSPADFQMVLRSFCRVYPHTSLWYTGVDTVVLGSIVPHARSLAELQERMAIPAVRASLAEVGVAGVEDLLQTFVMDPSRLPEVAGEGPVNSDGHPYLEFSAPRSHLVATTPRNLEFLLAHRRFDEAPLSGPVPGELRARAVEVGELEMQGALARLDRRPAEGIEPLRRALALDPEDLVVRHEMASVAGSAGVALVEQGKLAEGKALLDEARATGVRELPTLQNLATWAMRSGDPAAALAYVDESLQKLPDVPETHLRRALCLMALGRAEEARASCERAIGLNPGFTRAWLALAEFALAAGDGARALGIYEARLWESGGAGTPGDWVSFARLLRQGGRHREAVAAAEVATGMLPEEPAVWRELAAARDGNGDADGAAEALVKAVALESRPGGASGAGGAPPSAGS